MSIDSTHDDAATPAITLPFVVCVDGGNGPYDNEAFSAGFICGTVYTALLVGYPLGLDHGGWLAPRATVPQLELIGMDRGYPIMDVSDTDDPNTVYVQFTRGDETVHVPLC